MHHGDGVQEIFCDDPRVLTISLHETPLTLFPGTGFPDEIGGPGAEGSAVNVALPPGTGDAGWLRAFHAVVPVGAAGVPAADPGHPVRRGHPPARPAGRPAAVRGRAAGQPTWRCAALADELCDGRWVATGGGGYALVEVVPRAWTHLLAVATGEPLDPATLTPPAWRALAAPDGPGARRARCG